MVACSPSMLEAMASTPALNTDGVMMHTCIAFRKWRQEDEKLKVIFSSMVKASPRPRRPCLNTHMLERVGRTLSLW